MTDEERQKVFAKFNRWTKDDQLTEESRQAYHGEEVLWIPMTERLPEPNVPVLVFGSGGIRLAILHENPSIDQEWGHGQTEWCTLCDCSYDFGMTADDNIDQGVTHWQPLPAPPEGI